MCGIVGVVGKIDKTARAVFEQLLIVDSVRGADSTGFVTVKGKDVDFFKINGDPYFAKESKGYDRTLLKPSTVLIGHNRYATTGKVNRANAHPFDFPTCIGVHNGTLTNKYELLDGNKFEVDSEALYHNIDVRGVDDAVGSATGAWSLVWWDKTDDTINFLRNNERPMTYCLSEDGKTMYFASEGLMLHWILARNGVKHQAIVQTDVNKLYTIKVNNETEFVAKELNIPAIREVKGAPPKVHLPLYSGSAYQGNANTVVDITRYSSFLNVEVEFIPSRVIVVDGLTYVEGEVWQGKQALNALVEVNNDRAKAAWLLDDDEETGFLSFRGRVRAVRALNKEQYLLIPIHSVRGSVLIKKPASTANKGIAYPGYLGKALTMVQWRDLTEVGCECCGAVPLESETHDLEWTSLSTFKCKMCSDVRAERFNA